MGRVEWWSEVERRQDSGSGTAIHSHQNENVCGRGICWLLHWLYLGKWIAPPPPPPAPLPHLHTPSLLPACISRLIGFLRQWRSVMKKAVHGKYLGMLRSDVWQNESVRSWKSENVTTTVEVFHQHGDGSLGEAWKLFSPVVWECLADSKTFSHPLIPERKWVRMKDMQTQHIHLLL